MENYLKNKYTSYNEFSVCHVQAELLCPENEAKIIVKNVTGKKAIGLYFAMSFKEFVACVDVGLMV